MADFPITFTSGEVSTYYGARVPHLKRNRGTEWRGRCPIHGGKNHNFTVDPATGRWFCFSKCGRGGSLIDFEMTVTGADFKTALTTVCAIVGRPMPERGRISRDEWRAAQEAHEREKQERLNACYFADATRLMAAEALAVLPVDDPERAIHTANRDLSAGVRQIGMK